MAEGKLPTKSSGNEVDAFLRKVAVAPRRESPQGQRGRLIFAMDATASRQPVWDHACQIQGEMFQQTSALGGLEIQLAYYRGFGEFKASKWLTDEKAFLAQMTAVFCLAGETQLRKVLLHAVREAKVKPVNALIFVGDCMEEDVDALGAVAGELGLLGVPAFLFHEGSDPIAEFAFKQIARLTNGAYCRFDTTSAKTLTQLLRAVAVFAAGGRSALNTLAQRQGGAILKIAHQVSRS